jgi:ABC-type long-subunit fatty acid transport system fused permease/ATPase subunit
MAWTKTREIIAAIVALVLVILFGAVGAAVAGIRIPGLSAITDAIGINTQQ